MQNNLAQDVENGVRIYKDDVDDGELSELDKQHQHDLETRFFESLINNPATSTSILSPLNHAFIDCSGSAATFLKQQVADEDDLGTEVRTKVVDRREENCKSDSFGDNLAPEAKDQEINNNNYLKSSDDSAILTEQLDDVSNESKPSCRQNNLLNKLDHCNGKLYSPPTSSEQLERRKRIGPDLNSVKEDNSLDLFQEHDSELFGVTLDTEQVHLFIDNNDNEEAGPELRQAASSKISQNYQNSKAKRKTRGECNEFKTATTATAATKLPSSAAAAATAAPVASESCGQRSDYNANPAGKVAKSSHDRASIDYLLKLKLIENLIEGREVADLEEVSFDYGEEEEEVDECGVGNVLIESLSDSINDLTTTSKATITDFAANSDSVDELSATRGPHYFTNECSSSLVAEFRDHCSLTEDLAANSPLSSISNNNNHLRPSSGEEVKEEEKFTTRRTEQSEHISSDDAIATRSSEISNFVLYCDEFNFEEREADVVLYAKVEPILNCLDDANRSVRDCREGSARVNSLSSRLESYCTCSSSASSSALDLSSNSNHFFINNLIKNYPAPLSSSSSSSSSNINGSNSYSGKTGRERKKFSNSSSEILCSSSSKSAPPSSYHHRHDSMRQAAKDACKLSIPSLSSLQYLPNQIMEIKKFSKKDRLRRSDGDSISRSDRLKSEYESVENIHCNESILHRLCACNCISRGQHDRVKSNDAINNSKSNNSLSKSFRLGHKSRSSKEKPLSSSLSVPLESELKSDNCSNEPNKLQTANLFEKPKRNLVEKQSPSFLNLLRPTTAARQQKSSPKKTKRVEQQLSAELSELNSRQQEDRVLRGSAGDLSLTKTASPCSSFESNDTSEDSSLSREVASLLVPKNRHPRSSSFTNLESTRERQRANRERDAPTKQLDTDNEAEDQDDSARSKSACSNRDFNKKSAESSSPYRRFLHPSRLFSSSSSTRSTTLDENLDEEDHVDVSREPQKSFFSRSLSRLSNRKASPLLSPNKLVKIHIEKSDDKEISHETTTKRETASLGTESDLKQNRNCASPIGSLSAMEHKSLVDNSIEKYQELLFKSRFPQLPSFICPNIERKFRECLSNVNQKMMSMEQQSKNWTDYEESKQRLKAWLTEAEQKLSEELVSDDTISLNRLQQTSKRLQYEERLEDLVRFFELEAVDDSGIFTPTKENNLTTIMKPSLQESISLSSSVLSLNSNSSRISTLQLAKDATYTKLFEDFELKCRLLTVFLEPSQKKALLIGLRELKNRLKQIIEFRVPEVINELRMSVERCKQFVEDAESKSQDVDDIDRDNSLKGVFDENDEEEEEEEIDQREGKLEPELDFEPESEDSEDEKEVDSETKNNLVEETPKSGESIKDILKKEDQIEKSNSAKETSLPNFTIQQKTSAPVDVQETVTAPTTVKVKQKNRPKQVHSKTKQNVKKRNKTKSKVNVDNDRHKISFANDVKKSDKNGDKNPVSIYNLFWHKITRAFRASMSLNVILLICLAGVCVIPIMNQDACCRSKDD